MDKLVSVLVITYNQKDYIKKCLDSILRQSINDKIKIYIGDDASNDGTNCIINEYAQMYPNIVVPIIRTYNIGASANLADLIKRAEGKYLAFCEGDDFWISEFKLERQILFLDKNKSFIGVTHEITIVDENDNILDKKVEWISTKKISSLKTIDGIKIPGHLSSFVMRNIFNKGYIKLNVLCTDRNISDRLLYMIALSYGNIYHLKNKDSAYRLFTRGKQCSVLSSVYTDSRCPQDMIILNAMEKWLAKKGIKKDFINARSRLWVISFLHSVKLQRNVLGETIRLTDHKWGVFLRCPLALIKLLIINAKRKLMGRVR